MACATTQGQISVAVKRTQYAVIKNNANGKLPSRGSKVTKNSPEMRAPSRPLRRLMRAAERQRKTFPASSKY